MREVAIVLAVVLLTVTAVPAAASSHTNEAAVSVHDSEVDFDAGQFTGGIEIDGTGDDAVLTLNESSEEFAFTGSSDTYEIPDGVEQVVFILNGSGGEDGQDSGNNGGSGGSGGYVEATINVSDIPDNELDIWVGGGNGNTFGRSEGGSGGDGAGGGDGGNGAGSTEIVSDGTLLAAADGGGGGGGASDGDSDSGGGGGGARGGSGGSGDVDGSNGQPGEGTGNGGDGGNGGQVLNTNGNPGDDGGGEVAGFAADQTITTGGGNAGNADVQILLDPGDEQTYTSADHNVSNAQQGFVEFDTLDNVSANLTWQEFDGSNWSDVDSTTVTTAGNHSVDLSTATHTQFRVVVETIETGDDPAMTMTQEGVTATNRAPELSDPSPTGGGFVEDRPIELSVNVTDEDFSTEQGDEVTVTFYDGDDTELGSDTVTTNGTASIEHPDPVGGENEWYAEADDAYGGSDRSPDTGTHTFEAPGELEIRDEQTEELLGEVNATVEFFFERSTEPDLIVEREADNGTVDMTGLPPDESFVVSAEADGYFDRRIFVESLFDTQTIYLLDDEADAVSIEFILNDFSGRFDGEESILEVQRNINESWQTVEGDFFGAGGRFTATLALDKRHRLIVTNTQTGETRNLGTFTPTIAQQVPIEIFEDDDIIQTDTHPSIQWEPDVAQLPARDDVDIETIIRSGSIDFDSYSGDVEINGSTVASFSGSEPGGETFTETVDLTDRAGEEVTITVDFELEDGSTGSAVNTYIIREHFENDLALLPTLTVIKESMDEDGDVSRFSMMVSFIATIMAIGYTARTASTEVAATIGLVVLIGFVTVGWAPRSWLFAGGITALTLMGVQRL